MRASLPWHVIAYFVANVGFVALNLAPVGFDLARPGVPIWFPYPVCGWGLLLLLHAVVAALGIGRKPAVPAPEPEPPPAAAAFPRPQRHALDLGAAGKGGALLAESRQEAGQALAALGALGPIPVELDDLLRGAVDQCERLSERLGALYARGRGEGGGQVEAERARFEDLLAGLLRELKVLRLEAQAVESSAALAAVLANPAERLREAILCAAEALDA